jgi:hypothetical protein
VFDWTVYKLSQQQKEGGGSQAQLVSGSAQDVAGSLEVKQEPDQDKQE